MGYFSFAFIMTIVLGAMCFLLMGCSDSSQKTSLANIPPAPHYTENICDIHLQKKALIKEGDTLSQQANTIREKQDADNNN